MAFNIKIPFVIATHIKKFSSVTGIKNKNKAAGLGVVSNQLVMNSGAGASIPVSGLANVIAPSAATQVLTASQSGSVVLLNAASGVTVTLPAPIVGLWFEFIVTVTVTSNSHIIQTDAGTTFVLGTLDLATEATTPGANPGPKYFSGNGTSHVKVQMNSASTNATGGLIGSFLLFQCITTTQWACTGTVECGSGSTIATPFA